MPDLIILTNPAPVPHRSGTAWERFHLRDAKHARMVQVPRVTGMPEEVMALGYAQQMEFDGGPTVRWAKSDRGPWLVTDEDGQRLWIVAHGKVPHWRSTWHRAVVKAIAYFPFPESGKHDARRGYRHEFGEGGERPDYQWPNVYPVLSDVDGGRAMEFVDGEFVVRPEGIVG